jgi:hypothetical protein
MTRTDDYLHLVEEVETCSGNKYRGEKKSRHSGDRGRGKCNSEQLTTYKNSK